MTQPIRDLRATLDKVKTITDAVSAASAKVRGDVTAQHEQRTAGQGVGDGGNSGPGQG